VYYLNLLDVFIKVVKGIKYYGRYMDDFFVIGKSKAELASILTDIEGKLAELGLLINAKKTHIVKLSHGFTYLQIKYDVLPTGRLLKRPSHGKMFRERRRLRSFRRQIDNGLMTEGETWNCYKSWRGTVVKDHNACRKSTESLDALYTSLFPVHMDEAKEGRGKISLDILKDAEIQDIRYCLTN
jgi:hypothetical protein